MKEQKAKGQSGNRSQDHGLRIKDPAPKRKAIGQSGKRKVEMGPGTRERWTVHRCDGRSMGQGFQEWPGVQGLDLEQVSSVYRHSLSPRPGRRGY